MLRVEFTIEPFVEGHPGPHVLDAIAAVEALGLNVEFGPFATSFTADSDTAGRAISALIGRAYAHGATHVSVHIEPVESGDAESS